MAIRRSPIRKDQPWTTFSNELLQDPALRHDALGVLVYLISKPEDWTVQATELARRFKCGRDGIYRIMNDLIAAGYAQREQDRQKGKFAERCFIVFNEKQPLPEKPETAQPDTVNPTLQSKDSTKDRKSAPLYGEAFERLWLAYERYGHKKKAAEAFNKLEPEMQEQIIVSVPRYLASRGKDKTGRFVTYNLENFLRGEIYARHATLESVKRELPAPETFTRSRWDVILGVWRRNGKWSEDALGPAPGMPGSFVPADLLMPHEVEEANDRIMGHERRQVGEAGIRQLPGGPSSGTKISGAAGLGATSTVDSGRVPGGVLPGLSAGGSGGPGEGAVGEIHAGSES